MSGHSNFLTMSIFIYKIQRQNVIEKVTIILIEVPVSVPLMLGSCIALDYNGSEREKSVCDFRLSVSLAGSRETAVFSSEVCMRFFWRAQLSLSSPGGGWWLLLS